MASSLLLSLAIVTPSCAQQQKKAEPITKKQTKPLAVQKVKIPITGMVCMACQSTVKKAIKSLNGVTNVEVSLENKNAVITYYPSQVKPEQIQKAINDKGYTAGKSQEVK
jgi:mercuric ion binding protein